MRGCITAFGVVLVVLAFVTASASAAKPAPAGLSASLAITNTASTCSGTLTVSWNVSGKGITSLSWRADPSDTGTLGFAFGGENLAKAQRSGSVSVPFTLTAGTGKAEVSAPGFVTQTNTVTCTPATPDLTITNISLTAPAGYPPPWSYTVTVKNIGAGSAGVTNVVVQGYYTASTDTATFPPAGGEPACGTIMQPFATTLAPGESVDVFVGCGGNGPAVSTDTNLMVGVDVDHILSESSESNDVAVVPLG